MNAFKYHLARSFLRKQNAAHVTRQPQLACFAFDLITLYIHLDGRYEDEELEFLAKRIFPKLKARDACLDIGANIGNHAVAFAPHFKTIVALEPNPRTFALLSYNASLANNITALNVGASREDRSIMVTQDPLNIAATSVASAGRAGAAVAFDLRRIDDLDEVRSAGPIGFLKIDVEGHEREALEGAEDTLERHGPVIAMEVLESDVEGGTTGAVEFLRRRGYRHFYELRAGGKFSAVPRKLYKFGKTVFSVLTGKRPTKALRMVEVDRLDKRSYLMLLCAKEPLSIEP